MSQDELWHSYFRDRYAGAEIAPQDLAALRNESCRGVANPVHDDVSSWGTARMRRFVAQALPLGKEAVGAAVHDAGITARDLGMLLVVARTVMPRPALTFC